MSNVNRNPAGALELLNLNLQGEFPRLLAQAISPVYEMSSNYYQGLGLLTATATAVLAAPNAAVAIVVPTGETWALRGVGLKSENLDGPASYQSVLRIQPPGPIAVPIVIAPGGSILTNQFSEIGAMFPQPFLLGSGTAIQGVCNIISGVPVNGFNAVLSILFHRLSLS